MLQSHASQKQCGLTSAAADKVVGLVQREASLTRPGEVSKLYGACSVGHAASGVVCVLAAAGQTDSHLEIDSVQKVIARHKPLPSQLRAQTQAKQLSDHLAAMDFHPGQKWKDTDGDTIQAHGGGVIYHEGVYYWYGENKAGSTYTAYSLGYSPPRVDVIGVSVYSSTDFVRWAYEGLALKGGSHPDIDPSMVLERPKVIHNRQTGKFIMWMHIDTADYELARTGVAVSDSPVGPFRYQGSFRPHGQQSRDFTVYADTDTGMGYLAYSSENNRVMHISALTPDYTHVTSTYTKLFVNMAREAPAMFKHKGVFLIATSGCTGWEPNKLEVFWTWDPLGDWKSLGYPCTGGSDLENAFTFFSQPNFVMAMPEHPGSFVFMADQWDPEDLSASRYVWLPMWVDDNPEAQHDAKVSAWTRLNPFSSTHTIAPVEVEVRWYDAWSMSHLSMNQTSRQGCFINRWLCKDKLHVDCGGVKGVMLVRRAPLQALCSK
ncbi:hypothetical protein WJX82_011147 [Trebouxia sp. C0006]